MEVLGSGALNLDLVYEIPDLGIVSSLGIRLKPGEELAVDHDLAERLLALLEDEGRKVAESGGGSAANTICVLAARGVSAGYVGTVGDDPEGDLVLSSMKGVDCSLVARQGRTALCIVLLETKTLDRTLLVAPNPEINTRFSRDLLKKLSTARLLHLSSMIQQRGLDFHKEMVGHLGKDQILSLDPGEIYASKGLDALSELFARTDLLFITEQEVEKLTSRPLAQGLEVLLEHLHKGARELLPFEHTGGPVILCKRGKEGAVLYSPLLKRRVFAKKDVRVVDNTGAGDAFDAGFILGVLRGMDPASCLDLAAETAALSLTDYGRSWLYTDS